jgi:hypothetical protein
LVQFNFVHLLAFEHTQNKIEPAYGQDIFLIEIMIRLITAQAADHIENAMWFRL